MPTESSMSPPHGTVRADRFRARESRRESCSSSPGSLAWPIRLFALLSLIGVCVLFGPVQAQAATWPLSTSAYSYTCGFHESYSAGGKTYTHSGMDVLGYAGASVCAPCAGTVTYVGSVPSGDARVGTQSSGQSTMKAISVKIANGRTVTLMPIDSASVSRGDEVAEGEQVGTLAASGDVSTSGVHLHMGLKEDGTYYDPMTLFGASSSSETQAAATAAAGEQAAAQEQSASEASTSEVEILETEGQTSSQTAGATQGAADEVTQAQEEFGTISSGDVEYAPSTQQDLGLLQRAGLFATSLAQACAAQLQGLLGALQLLSGHLGLPLAAVGVAIGAAALVLLAAAAFVGARVVTPLVSRLFSGKIAPLFMRKAGDKLPQLFPASGTAFTSRSR